MTTNTRKTAEEWAKELMSGCSEKRIAHVLESYLHQETKGLLEALEFYAFNPLWQRPGEMTGHKAKQALTTFKERHK